MNKNISSIVSAVHSLKIIDITRLSLFSNIGSRVVLSFMEGEKAFESIPGSVTVSSGISGNLHEKEIRCLSSKVGMKLVDSLIRFSRSLLIAIYTDGRGMLRVCGSPEYPLTLKFTLSEGVASIVLTGKTDREDGYLMVG